MLPTRKAAPLSELEAPGVRACLALKNLRLLENQAVWPVISAITNAICARAETLTCASRLS
jgi:hypothetical protein